MGGMFSDIALVSIVGGVYHIVVSMLRGLLCGRVDTVSGVQCVQELGLILHRGKRTAVC